MLRPSGRWAAVTGFALLLVLSAPALASAHGAASAQRLGVDNTSRAVVVPRSASLPSAARSVIPLAAYAFPSSSSTVIGSVGFIDDVQVGYFWSAARGDSVAETFGGPGHVKKIILKLDVVDNVLAAGAEVDWTVAINGTDVGSFTVLAGQVGPITEKFSFPEITGGSYAVKMRVTNEVAAGDGSHTLRYAGDGPHSVRLCKK
jgi:hypothetical protein